MTKDTSCLKSVDRGNKQLLRRFIAREFVNTPGVSLGDIARKYCLSREVVRGIVLSFYREPVYKKILRERGLDRFNNVAKVIIVCEQCGKEVEVTEKKAEERRFCTKACLDEWNGLHHNRWRFKGGGVGK